MTNVKDKIKKQILFAHSGGKQSITGQGSYDLIVSLRSKLTDEFDILYPIIENPEAPTYAMWKEMFNAEFSKINIPIVLLGHSLGGSMLLKYLSEEKPTISILGLFLVATPFWGQNGWDVEDFVLPKNFKFILKDIAVIYLYHCINDNFVPFKHLRFYKKAFSSAIVRELPGKYHAFSKGLPELVRDIKDIE